jgi:DNA-directed RNA polymerase subunit RPC12/RpoP
MPTTESSNFIPASITKTVEITVYKCAKCGAELYGPLLWRVTVENSETGRAKFDGLACERCQRELLDTRVAFIDRAGNIW